jgi:hypothetical protein
MESNAQPKQLMVAKKIKLKQQEEFTLCGDLLFGHNSINCVSLNPTKQNKVDVLTKVGIIIGIIVVPSNYLFSY